MCGICGLLEAPQNDHQVEAELLLRMRDTMAHRGPDDAGLYLSRDRKVGLGHRRLSIIDTSNAGHQPMSNEDGSVIVVFNGEIYNHVSLRRDLEREGHVFRSEADTEVLPHLYEDHGPGLVNYLDGMFAFGLWDERKNLLLLARDRLGIKPLVWAHFGDLFLFASEVKAILAHPGVPRNLDERTLYHYLTFLTTPSPRTLLRGIRKLAPGQRLIFKPGRPESPGHEPRIDTYWEPLTTGITVPASPEEAMEEILRLQREATRKRLMSDVPFGAFLSGGLDSAATVSSMSEAMDQPVNTFSVGFRGAPSGPHNELAYAREIASKFGTRHHEIEIGEHEVLDSLPLLSEFLDDPVGSSMAVSGYYVAKLAREHGVVVAQVGEGADEIFAGYPRYQSYVHAYEGRWNQVNALPRSVRRLLFGLWHATSPDGPRTELLRRAAFNEDLYWGYENVMGEKEKKSLLSQSFISRLGDISSYEVVDPLHRAAEGLRPDLDPHARMAYVDLKLHLSERLLMRVDRTSMASSVEVRVPFLDHKLVELALNLPVNWKIEGERGKAILRDAFGPLLPAATAERPKIGFLFPLRLLPQETLQKLCRKVLFESVFSRQEILRREVLERWISQTQDPDSATFFPLEILLFLALWYCRWVENEPAL